MKAKNDENRSSYQSLPVTSQKLNNKRASSPDSRDADTEASSSENEENRTKEQPFKELQDYSEKPPMSTKRRVCLVGSLLLCVFTVFAFAFILPCHHKTCLKETKLPNWSKNFTGVAPLVLRDISSTNTPLSERLLVGFSHSGRGFHILNQTCPGCHGGIVAIDGRDGHQLWASGVFGQIGQNIICDLTVKMNQISCIALENKNKILRIDPNNGSQHWAVRKTGTVKAFMAIEDTDDDGVGDIVMLYVPRDGFSSELRILSGKTGKPIGGGLTVMKRPSRSDLGYRAFLCLHHLTNKERLLLVGIKKDSEETGTLFVIGTKELIKRARNKTTVDMRWGRLVPNQHGFIELFKDTLVLTPPIFVDLNNDGVKDIVLCSLEGGLSAKAINGKDTSILWSRKLTSIGVRRALPKIIPFGDKLTDVAIMLQIHKKSTRIVVLNGRNGLALWTFTLNSPLTVTPVGTPQRSNTPRGLLLWLPKINIRKYNMKRGSVNVPSYLTDTLNTKGNYRRRRGSDYLDDKESDVLLQDFLDYLISDEKEYRRFLVQEQVDIEDPHIKDHGKEEGYYGDGVTYKATNIDNDVKEQSDVNNHLGKSRDDSYRNDNNKPITGHLKTGEIVDLRDYLINLEKRLKRTTYSRNTKPTSAISETMPTHLSTAPLTGQSTAQALNPSSENMVQPSKRQEDKPLNCDLPLNGVNKDISAVLVYRDTKQQLQLMEVIQEKAISIAPEDFVNKFGEQPPTTYTCVQLLPTITTTPIVTDIDNDGQLDLIYTVDYITQDPSTATSTHLMKLRKVDISDAISMSHNRKLITKSNTLNKRNYKRNENFDSPFLIWNT